LIMEQCNYGPKNQLYALAKNCLGVTCSVICGGLNPKRLGD
jgi:hypothetical protein